MTQRFSFHMRNSSAAPSCRRTAQSVSQRRPGKVLPGPLAREVHHHVQNPNTSLGLQGQRKWGEKSTQMFLSIEKAHSGSTGK